MSETVSAPTGAAPAASAPTSSGVSQSSGASQTPNTGAPSQTQGQTNQSQAPTGQAERFLAEQDLDAFVEHTVNGQKQKIKIKDALNSYGLEKTAHQRMQEAAQERKRAQQLARLFETDPKEYFRQTGGDYDAWMRTQFSSRKDLAEEILAKEYELQQMDPNQRRALELENENKTLKERMAAEKAPVIEAIKNLLGDATPRGLENASVQELSQFYKAKSAEFQQGIDGIQNEMLAAWEQTGLPRVKDFGVWMAQVMMDHEKRSAAHKKQTGEVLPPLQPAQAADRVKQRFLRSSQALYDQMDGKSILTAIGEKAAEKLRAHLIELASPSDPRFATNANRPAPAASEPKKSMNQMEFRKWAGI